MLTTIVYKAHFMESQHVSLQCTCLLGVLLTGGRAPYVLMGNHFLAVEAECLNAASGLIFNLSFNYL